MSTCRWSRSLWCVLAVVAILTPPTFAAPQRGNNSAQSRDAFKIFDNLYYVGIDTVSAVSDYDQRRTDCYRYAVCKFRRHLARQYPRTGV